MMMKRRAAQQGDTLYIIHTTDVHGMVFAHDPIEQTTHPAGISRLATLLRQVPRHQRLLLDSGDCLQGSPAVYASTLQSDRPLLTSAYMNLLGYDAVTIGNHDIEMGAAVYDRFNSECHCPILAANACNTATQEPYFEPYTIIEREGWRIAVIGITTEVSASWVPQRIRPGLTLCNTLKAARNWVTTVREKHKPDLVIGLFHNSIGSLTDGVHPADNCAQTIAHHTGGAFDLILAGHDHHKHTTTSLFGDKATTLTNPGSSAYYVGMAMLKANEQGRLQLASYEAIALADYAEDADFVQQLEPYITHTASYISTPICAIKKPLYSRLALFGPTAWEGIIHKAMQWYAQTKFSLASPLLYDAAIAAGTLDIGATFKLFPYENTIQVVEMSGRELTDYLEACYDRWVNTVGDKTTGLLRTAYDPKWHCEYIKNPTYDFESAHGIDYEVDITQEKGCRINILQCTDGEPFELDKRYRVAMNSYRAAGGAALITLGAGISEAELPERIVWDSGIYIREVLAQFLAKADDKVFDTPSNWAFVPKALAKRAARESEKRLFGEIKNQE